MKRSIIRNCLLILISIVSIGGCGGTVIIVSKPAPPLNSDFNGGTVIVVADGTSNIAGFTSNGDEVVIVTRDSDESLLGLVGLAISGTECQIMMFTKDPSEGFYDANGKCRLEEDGTVFRLEQVAYDGHTLDLIGKVRDEVSSESENKKVNGSHPDMSEDMLDFQEDIVQSLSWYKNCT
jgi:hypothetical protein